MSQVDDPIAVFRDAFERAQALEAGRGSIFGLLRALLYRLVKARMPSLSDANAMTLATADAEGRPSARVVLLKGVDERGFVFYTNYGSRKARELTARPYAALCAHFVDLAVQVRVEGEVERVSDAESDAYFASRPRISQLGAWASRQSEPLGSREELQARVDEFDKRYPDKVPRPPFWGGFRVVPDRLEFWYGKVGRLHDRILYEREGASFRQSRLYP